MPAYTCGASSYRPVVVARCWRVVWSWCNIVFKIFVKLIVGVLNDPHIVSSWLRSRYEVKTRAVGESTRAVVQFPFLITKSRDRVLAPLTAHSD